MWEGKEEEANWQHCQSAQVPKFSHLCGSSRKQEDECSQGDQEVEKVRKKQEN